MFGEIVYYLFALGFHVFGCFVFGGVIAEIADPNGNWDGSKPCYRGNGLQFTDAEGNWYDYGGSAPTALNEDPPCNDEATAELIMIAVGSAFVAADTIFTVFSWMLCSCGVFEWPGGSSFGDVFSKKTLFKTWDDSGQASSNTNQMARMFYKMLRMMSIFGAYLSTFIWACGYTASFNSRPYENGNIVRDTGITMHEDNFAFANSGFFVAAMISILVTILPRNEDSGYAVLE